MKSLREKLITNAMVQYEKIISDLASEIEQWSGQGYSGMDDISNIELAKLEQAKCQIRLGDLYRMANQMPPISVAVDDPDHHPSATKATAANEHYASAGKILEDLLITLKPIDDAVPGYQMLADH